MNLHVSLGERRTTVGSAGLENVTQEGEILNLAEIGHTLDLPAESKSSDVLLAGWRRWGRNLFPHLAGTFSLAIETNDGLVLYRDPSGLISLYFARTNHGRVAFSGRLASFRDMVSDSCHLERRSLHEYLRFLEIAPPHTLLAEVSAVQPGHAVECAAGAVVVHPLPSESLPATGPEDFSTAVAELCTQLDRSVAACLKGAARPAAFLSGGIDSTLINALAVRHRPDLVAITVGFDDQGYDETPVAQRIADHLGLRHETLRFTRQQFLDAFDRLSRLADQPMADPAALATLLSFEYVASTHDVVLDGTGADEAVGLMPPRHVRIAVQHASRLPGKLRRNAARLMRRLPQVRRFAPILDFDHPADMMARWQGFTRTEIEGLCDEPVTLEHTQFMKTFARHPRQAHFERYSALLNAMTSDRLNQAIAISGAKLRFPFWDPDTVRFIRQLRTEFRYLPGQPKRILRALLARFVPADVCDQPKHGFDFPLREFLAGDDFMLVRRHLDARRWHDYGILSTDTVRDMADRFMAGDRRLTFRTWALVVLGAWLEHREPLWGRR